MQRLVNERFAARISIQAVVAARNPLCGRRRTFNTPAIGLSGKSLTRRFKSRNIGRALERPFVPPFRGEGKKGGAINCPSLTSTRALSSFLPYVFYVFLSLLIV